MSNLTIITDTDSPKLVEKRHYPWGTDRYVYSTTPTTFRFTGQRNESGIGLYFYGARWYDASAARFIQADSIVPSHNQGTEESKHIQIMLVVDYHEPSLLAELGYIYRSDLLNTDQNSEKAGKPDILNPNPINNNQREQNNHKDIDNSNNVYQPLVDFNQQRNWGKPQNNPRQEDEGNNNENNLVDMMPTRLNSMGFDRYAYTSNCPTKYTDPSGHCDLKKAISGAALAGIGLIPFSLGLATVLKGSAEAISSPAAGPAAPMVLFHGWEQIVFGGIMMSAGEGIIIVGGITVYKSDCIQELIDELSNQMP